MSVTIGDSEPISWHAYRRGFDLASDDKQDWQGIPVFLPGMPVVLHDRHPLAKAYRELSTSETPWPTPPAGQVAVERTCSTAAVDEGDERIVNHWRSRVRQVDVYVCRRASTGRATVITIPFSPDRSMDRLKLWLSTLGASDAWDLGAEARAIEKLAKMVTDRQLRHYTLTGSFLEHSTRSDLHYLFRRSRPTVALSARWWSWATSGPKAIESARCLAVLCLHPIGYYEDSWAGCMVPTDDVIAHLCLMRADEAGFWKAANQHDAASPEAGL